MSFELERAGFYRVRRREFFTDIVTRPSHNNVVAWGLRDRVVLTDVMRLTLEPEFFDSLDWSRLRVEESIFVDSRNRLSLDDARFSVPYRDGSGVQYFVDEHKSKPELRAFQQLLTSVWRDAALSSRYTRSAIASRSYLTVPFLFYTGGARWIFCSPAPSLSRNFLISPKSRLYKYTYDELFYKFSVVHSNWRTEQIAPRTFVFFDLLERVATRSPKLRSYDWFEPLRGVKGNASLEKFKRILNSYWSDSLMAIEKRTLTQREILEIVAALGDEGALRAMNATFEMLKKEGRKEGRKEGGRKRNAELIVRQLNARFGSCPDYLKEQVASCRRKSTMETLLDAAYQSASLEDFESIADSYLGLKSE